MREDIRTFLGHDPERRGRAASFFEASDIEADIGEALLDAHIDAAERLDPSNAATSLLTVRLSGMNIVDGWVDQAIQDEILGPFTQEVEYAAPASMRNSAKLGLVGVSAGSVLLHYRPRSASIEATPGQLRYDLHPVDSAIHRISDLHDLLEGQAKAAEVASAFKNYHSVLRQARKLVEALDRYSINFSTRWWGPTSNRRTSRLTQRGQQHGLGLFAAAEAEHRVQVQGMVTALDITGVVTVTGAAGTRYKVDVGTELVSNHEFALGSSVFMLTERKQDVDGVGVSQGHARYEFLHHLGQAPLDL